MDARCGADRSCSSGGPHIDPTPKGSSLSLAPPAIAFCQSRLRRCRGGIGRGPLHVHRPRLELESICDRELLSGADAPAGRSAGGLARDRALRRDRNQVIAFADVRHV